MARRDTYVIELRLQGAARVNRGLRSVERQASATRRTLAFLRSFLVVFASVQIFAGIFRLADAFTNLNNRLRLLSDNEQVIAALRSELFRMAQETRTPIEGLTETFFKLSRSTLQMGLTFKELVDISTTVAKAVKLSGSTAASAEAGLIQFAQGLAGGSLEGQELASVVEQLPGLADIIAREFAPELEALGLKAEQASNEGLGGLLRVLNRIETGVITVPRLIKAINEAFESTRETFEKVRPTISDAFTELRNQAILFAGRLNQATGAADALVRAIRFIGENIATVILAFTAFIGVLAFNIVISEMLKFGRSIGFVLLGVLNLTRGVTSLAGVMTGALLTGITAVGRAFFTLIGASIVTLLTSIPRLVVAFTSLSAVLAGGLLANLARLTRLFGTLAAIMAGGLVTGVVKLARGFLVMGAALAGSALAGLVKFVGLIFRLGPLLLIAGKAVAALVIAAVAIGVVVAAWNAWGGEIKGVIERLGGITGILTIIIAGTIAAVKTIIDEFQNLPLAVVGAFVLLGEVIADNWTAITDFILKVFVSIFEEIVGRAKLFGEAIVLALTGEFEQAGEALFNALNFTKSAATISAERDKLENDQMGFLERSKQAAIDVGNTFETEFGKAKTSVESLFATAAGGLSPEAIDALLRITRPTGSSTAGPPTRVDEDAAKELEKVQKALDGLLSSISPARKATLELAEATKILNDAKAKELSLIFSEEEILRRVRREIIGVGNATTDYQESVALLNSEFGESATEAEKALRQFELFQEFAGDVIALEDAVSPLAAATRELTEAQLKLNVAAGNGVKLGLSNAEIMRRTERDIVGVGNATAIYTEKQILLNRALEKGAITQEEFRNASRKNRIEVLEDQRTLVAGVERAMLKIEESFGDTASNVEQAFTTVFQNLEDRLVDFIETGEFSIREFLDTIRQEISRVFVREAIGELSTIFNDVFENVIPTGGVDPEAAASEALVVAKTNEQFATQALTTQLTTLTTVGLPNFNTQITTLGITTLPAFNAACNSATICLNNLCTAAAGAGGSAGGGSDTFGGLGGLLSSGLSLFSSPNTVRGPGTFGTSNPLETGFSGNPHFQHGGSFIVGPGSGIRQLGNDNRLVPLNLQDGEQVDITPRGGRRRQGGTVVNINVTGAENGDRFKRNQNGVTSRIAGAVSRAEQRNR